ncbi:LOW QUALITY PROTEIN: Gag polyprotein [Plecturocebus cupreus]
MAAAQAGMTAAAFIKQKFNKNDKTGVKCYRCGGMEHVTKVCQAAVPPITRQSHKRVGQSLANLRNVPDATEAITGQMNVDLNGMPKSGNGQRGQSRPPLKFGTPILQESPQIAAPKITTANPFLSSFGQPQTVQDLTSVPPPDKY